MTFITDVIFGTRPLAARNPFLLRDIKPIIAPYWLRNRIAHGGDTLMDPSRLAPLTVFTTARE